MRLALDVRTLSAPKTGDRTVTLGLLQGLLEISTPPLPEVVAISHRPPPADVLPPGDRLRTLVAPRPGGYLWMPVAFPRGLRRARADIAVIQYLGPLTTLPCPLVTFVHDTVWRDLPHTFPPRDRLILDTFLPGTIARAAAVCTGSRFAAGRLAEHFPPAAGKLHVIPYGIQARYFDLKDAAWRQAVSRKYNLPDRFILSVGVLQPRKNIAGLMRAYHQLPAELRRDYGLVIVGKRGWLTKALPDLAAEAGPGVHFTGYVPDEDLPALYSLASCFAYPSLYEGYGLPPLEAMACGTPVLTSDVASLPEVTARAALLADPTDERALAMGLQRLLTDEALRRDLIARGLARAAELTWQRAARELLQVCAEVLAA